jgi:hypothetical protein
MTMLINGSHLCRKLQEEAKARFVHRHTGEHIPDWARKPMPNGNSYPLLFSSDSDWLNNTDFFITQKGELSNRERHCVSHPTYPNNPELRTA